MSELIDFSDREDEFLDRDLRQRVLAFAIISAVLGFAFSSLLFLGKKLGPASVILDRRAAEGKVVTSQGRLRNGGNDSYAPFRPPRVREEAPTKREVKPPWLGLNVVADSEESNETESLKQSKEKRVVETTIGLVPEYVQKKKSGSAVARSVKKVVKAKKAPDLHRLLFPLVAERPSRSSLSETERVVAANVFVLGNLRGEYQVGIVFDASGRAFVSSSLATSEYLDRIWIGGSMRRAKLLANDREMGIALIQLDGQDFENISLSPVPPAVGERVLSFASRGKGAAGRACRVGPTFGAAGFFLDGDLGPAVQGAPIFNDRGELAGYYVHSLPGAPGGGLHLAVDSAALNRLVRGYQGGGGSVAGMESEAVSKLEALLLRGKAKEQVRRGRILAGTGLSDFYLGMSSKEADKWLSTPEKLSVGAGLELWRSPAPPVTLYFANQRLAMAATEHNGFATPQGLSAGAPADLGQMARDYPGMELYSGWACAPGLDILFNSDPRVTGFVVKPDLSKP